MKTQGMFKVFDKFMEVVEKETNKEVMGHWANYKKILKENHINYPLAYQYIAKIHQQHIDKSAFQSRRTSSISKYFIFQRFPKKQALDLKSSSSYSSYLKLNDLTTPQNPKQKQQNIISTNRLLASVSSNSNIQSQKQYNFRIIGTGQYIRKLKLSNQQIQIYCNAFKKQQLIIFNSSCSFIKVITMGYFYQLIKQSHLLLKTDSIWSIFYQANTRKRIQNTEHIKIFCKYISIILSKNPPSKQINYFIHLALNQERFMQSMIVILKQKLYSIIEKNTSDPSQKQRNRMLSLTKVNWKQYRSEYSNLLSKALQKQIQVHVIKDNFIQQFTFCPYLHHKTKIVVFVNKEEKISMLAINQSDLVKLNQSIHSITSKQYEELLRFCHQTLSIKQIKPTRVESVNACKSTKSISGESPMYFKYGMQGLISQKKDKQTLLSPKLIPKCSVESGCLVVKFRQLLTSINTNTQKMILQKGNSKQKQCPNPLLSLDAFYPIKK